MKRLTKYLLHQHVQHGAESIQCFDKLKTQHLQGDNSLCVLLYGLKTWIGNYNQYLQNKIIYLLNRYFLMALNAKLILKQLMYFVVFKKLCTKS